jgi:hypothetical protein
VLETIQDNRGGGVEATGGGFGSLVWGRGDCGDGDVSALRCGVRAGEELGGVVCGMAQSSYSALPRRACLWGTFTKQIPWPHSRAKIKLRVR